MAVELTSIDTQQETKEDKESENHLSSPVLKSEYLDART